jgi:hypothetical protein
MQRGVGPPLPLALEEISWRLVELRRPSADAF